MYSWTESGSSASAVALHYVTPSPSRLPWTDQAPNTRTQQIAWERAQCPIQCPMPSGTSQEPKSPWRECGIFTESLDLDELRMHAGLKWLPSDGVQPVGSLDKHQLPPAVSGIWALGRSGRAAYQRTILAELGACRRRRGVPASSPGPRSEEIRPLSTPPHHLCWKRCDGLPPTFVDSEDLNAEAC